MRNRIEHMRDCVRKSFEEGVERGHKFQKMRHAIIVELKRLGFNNAQIEEMLLKWNERCERVLRPAEVRKQLLDYIKWVDKRECKTGCKALEDYCIGKEKCRFYRRLTFQKRLLTQTPLFDINELEVFLKERYRKDAYTIMAIVRTLRRYQHEKATGEIIYIGYRHICSRIMEKYKMNLYPMDAYRKVQLLIDENVIERIYKGKKGTFGQPANGYRLLPWKAPKRVGSKPNTSRQITGTHINSYV